MSISILVALILTTRLQLQTYEYIRAKHNNKHPHCRESQTVEKSICEKYVESTGIIKKLPESTSKIAMENQFFSVGYGTDLIGLIHRGQYGKGKETRTNQRNMRRKGFNAPKSIKTMGKEMFHFNRSSFPVPLSSNRLSPAYVCEVPLAN